MLNSVRERGKALNLNGCSDFLKGKCDQRGMKSEDLVLVKLIVDLFLFNI